MRALTFAGYLKSYVPYLAETNSLAMSRLLKVAADEPRVTEPLLLMATVTGRSSELARRLYDTPELLEELRLLETLMQSGKLETALETEDPRLREEYTKTWRSYVARRDAPQRDARLKHVARERALALEATRKVTRYRMAKDLGLNPGNLHAFLSQEKVDKLSLDRAHELVEYLEAAA
jgi:hypothetical protein